MERGSESDGAAGVQTPPAGIEPSVRLDRVSKHFGDLVAVRDLDLDIGRGEFFTLLGPSGCGKTTTLRMVAGFEEPTAGRVLIEGQDVVGLPSYRRPTNTVFQSYALFPHLSVRENVAFGLRRKKVAKDEIERRVAAELERVRLAAEINRKPNQLSGGQQQRVALARALVNLPKVLLLDEPLGSLDLKLRKGLQIELKRIQREVGITFVYVTHDQEEALTMSDRIAVMSNGVVEQVDTPERRLRASPNHLRRRLHRRLQPDARHGHLGERRSRHDPPGQRPRAGDVSGRHGGGRALPRRGPAGEAPDRRTRASARLTASQASRDWSSASVYLGTSTQIVVRLAEDVRMTVLVPNADEAERSRLPGGGAPGEAELGTGAHSRGARFGDRARDRNFQSTDFKPRRKLMLDQAGTGIRLPRRRTRDRRVWKRRHRRGRPRGRRAGRRVRAR